MDLLNLVLLISLAGRSLCNGEEKPTIYDLTIGSKLVENKRFFLTCLAPGGDGEVNFEWFLNGQKVVPNENVYVNNLEDSSMLNIRSMNLELSGEYECRVSNRFGKDRRSISVKLEGEILAENEHSEQICFKNSNKELFSQAQVSRRTDGHPDETELPVFNQMQNNRTAHSDNQMGKTIA